MSYSVLSMISDVANLKDLNSETVKSSVYDVIKKLLMIATGEMDDPDTVLAKKFAAEFNKALVGIANDILIDLDNVTDKYVQQDDDFENEETKDDSEYDEAPVEIIDENKEPDNLTLELSPEDIQALKNGEGGKLDSLEKFGLDIQKKVEDLKPAGTALVKKATHEDPEETEEIEGDSVEVRITSENIEEVKEALENEMKDILSAIPKSEKYSEWMAIFDAKVEDNTLVFKISATFDPNKPLEEKKEWSKDIDIKEGSMREILGVPEDKTIADIFDSAESAVKKLIDAVGREKAAGMINFAANINKEDNFLDKMQKVLSSEKDTLKENFRSMIKNLL